MIESDNFEKQFEEEFEKQKRAIKKPNLMIVGGTGVGKSSLVNLVFGEEVAKVGNGKPITKGCDRYENENIPIVIYDTEGYEINDKGESYSNFNKVVLKKIEEFQTLELDKQIHVVWYCISISNKRITDYDISILKKLRNTFSKKICIVFTQCDNDNETNDGKGEISEEFKKVILRDFEKIDIFETSNNKELKLDLDNLIDWTEEVLPNEELKNSFIASQKCSLEKKRKKAYEIVAGFATTTAASAGLNPFPLSDSLLIVPQQIAMIIKITNIFGFNSSSKLILSIVETQIVSFVGKQLATSLLKLIPGFGQIVNAGVAGIITGGIGAAIIEIYTKILQEFYKTGKMPEFTNYFSHDIFYEYLKKGVEQWKKK